MENKINEIPIENLCDTINKDKDIKLIGRGLSSTVYLTNENKVLKEIYLENNDFNNTNKSERLIKNRKFNELYVNYLLSYEYDFLYLKPYTIPFHSYDVCINEKGISSMILKFDNGGSTLYEYLGYLDIKELRNVVIKLLNIVKELNENGIYHNDIHPGNIFYNPITSEIKLGDWGRGKYDNSSLNKENKKYENLDLFFSSLYIDTIFMTYMNVHKKLKKLYELLKIKGLYNKYLKDVKREIEYQKKNFIYKPIEFLQSLEPDIHIRFLKSYFVKNNFLRDKLISLSGISPQILSYLESLM